jgi:hypothetical protein
MAEVPGEILSYNDKAILLKINSIHITEYVSLFLL